MATLRKFFWLVFVGLGGVCGAAQPSGPTPAITPTPSLPLAVTVPPLPTSPVEHFRRLLALSSAEVEAALAGKPETQRALLKAKLQEYTALSPEDRERRLRATELRWILPRLMELPATNRAELLRAVRAEDRDEVEERLNQWDRLPAETQREVLENEWTIPYFIPLEAASSAERETVLNRLPADRRARLERKLAEWRALPADHRERRFARVQQFFELTPMEKQKTLNTLSESERKQMEETLAAFERLPPAQRRACLNSFSRFASLPPEEQAQFLKNADRWSAMTQADRDLWRKVVTQLPPLPLGVGHPPLPPVPQRGTTRPPSLPLVATNLGQSERH